MSALFRRVGVVVIALDLLAGGVAAAALHNHSKSPTAGGARMSAAQLEQTVSIAGTHVSCSSDPTGGWDYHCIGSDGSRALYDVSADSVTQESDLPAYR